MKPACCTAPQQAGMPPPCLAANSPTPGGGQAKGGGDSGGDENLGIILGPTLGGVIGLLCLFILWREWRRRRRPQAARRTITSEVTSTTCDGMQLTGPPAKPRGDLSSTLPVSPADETWGPSPSASQISAAGASSAASSLAALPGPRAPATAPAAAPAAAAEDGRGRTWRLSNVLTGLPGFGARPTRREAGGPRADGSSARSSSAESLDEPTEFNQYERVRLLGRGTYGCAVLLRRRGSGELVVAKEVPLGHLGGQAGLKAVQNEVRILAALSHAHIISYKATFTDGDLLSIVMEYADGGTLADAIGAQVAMGKLPFESAAVARWAAEVASALQHVHAAKILHRDLKAANIFLTAAGATKLGDFGISRSMSTQTNLAETVCGTPYYMSPEIIMGKPYGVQADAWALGVLLFELLALCRPFEADNIGHLVMRISQGKYDAAALEGSAHPPLLLELASRSGLLDPSPDSRITLAQLQERLRQPEAEPATAAG